jgi:hypothetical protein
LQAKAEGDDPVTAVLAKVSERAGAVWRYRAFEGYLLPQPHFEQLVQKQQTRLAVANEANMYLTAKQQSLLNALQESVGKVERRDMWRATSPI